MIQFLNSGKFEGGEIQAHKSALTLYMWMLSHKLNLNIRISEYSGINQIGMAKAIFN